MQRAESSENTFLSRALIDVDGVVVDGDCRGRVIGADECVIVGRVMSGQAE